MSDLTLDMYSPTPSPSSSLCVLESALEGVREGGPDGTGVLGVGSRYFSSFGGGEGGDDVLSEGSVALRAGVEGGDWAGACCSSGGGAARGR